MDTDPMCRHGCLELENANHVLTTCEKYSEDNIPIKEFFQKNNLTWCSTNLLGLNPSLSKLKEIEIRDLLVQFNLSTKIHLIL
jgi:hypothetical protein